MDIEGYWKAVLAQDAAASRPYFQDDAYVNWHNTNEHFSPEEFIRANCEYPGEWEGEPDRIERSGELVTTVYHVRSGDNRLSFHVVSFIRLKNDRIASVDEYWGDDGPAPAWRRDMGIGSAIK